VENLARRVYPKSNQLQSVKIYIFVKQNSSQKFRLFHKMSYKNSLNLSQNRCWLNFATSAMRGFWQNKNSCCKQLGKVSVENIKEVDDLAWSHTTKFTGDLHEHLSLWRTVSNILQKWFRYGINQLSCINLLTADSVHNTGHFTQQHQRKSNLNSCWWLASIVFSVVCFFLWQL